MPRNGETNVRTDPYCREHGTDYWQYAEGHTGNASRLVERNPDAQPGTLRWAPTSTASTALRFDWEFQLLEELDNFPTDSA